ncbi:MULTISPECIES: hypothetical protein [unclassified Methanobrevibacter]|nr:MULTISPECIES: hypothetical protein [unclassified Methanobrevibacter]
MTDKMINVADTHLEESLPALRLTGFLGFEADVLNTAMPRKFKKGC